MTTCDNCGVEGNMPVGATEDIRETHLETWFCSEECLVEFFQTVKELGK